MRVFHLCCIRFLCCLQVALALGLAAPSSNAQANVAPLHSSPNESEQKIFDLLNGERQKAGLSKLEWDEQTAVAARKHSILMAASADISHQLPGEAVVADRIANGGARFTVCAENVALADSTEEIHMALMHSPGHRANIMSPRYNAVGIGVVMRKGRLYVTQDFAFVTPAYSEAQFNQAFVDAFNRARKAKGHRSLDARQDNRMHAAACTSDGNIQSVLASLSGNVRVALFTLSEPQKLPSQLMDYVESSRLERMNVGVCFRPDQQHGAANFWVAVAFYE